MRVSYNNPLIRSPSILNFLHQTSERVFALSSPPRFAAFGSHEGSHGTNGIFPLQWMDDFYGLVFGNKWSQSVRFGRCKWHLLRRCDWMSSPYHPWLPLVDFMINVGKYPSPMDPIGFGAFKWANWQSTKILYKVGSYDRDKWSYKLLWGGLEPQLPIYFRPFIGVITPFDTSRGPSCRSRV